MNGRTLQQQRSDIQYSSPYRVAPTTTVLRSPWSSPSLKHSPQYGSRNRRHSRNRSQDMDYDGEYIDRRQRSVSDGLTLSSSSSSGGRSHYGYYDQEHQQDYGYQTLAHGLDTQSSSQRSRIHTMQTQSYNSEQLYSRPRRKSLSSYSNHHGLSTNNNISIKNLDRLGAIENSVGDHHKHYIIPTNKDQGKWKFRQQQQQQQVTPMVSTYADINNKSSHRRQEPAHLGHHQQQYYHSEWKMSGSRSSNSPTPPSLHDNSSSSSTIYTTPSSTSSAALTSIIQTDNHRLRNSNRDGVIRHHRKKSSLDGMDYPHQQKQSILASSTISTTTSSSSSSSSSNYHLVKPSISTNSSTSHHHHSYDDGYHDDQQNPCHQNINMARTRRYSQDYSGNVKKQITTNQSTTHIPRRVSTPKLRRVCSAKPYMERQPPPPPGSGNNNNNNDNDNSNGDDDTLLAATMDATSLYTATNVNGIIKERQVSPNFWNPRSEKDIMPVKRTLSRRIRGFLHPQRNKMDTSVTKDQQLVIDHQWSLTRPLTPTNELSFDNDALLEDQENGVIDNPFYMISQSWDIADRIDLFFDEDELLSVDTYVTNIQQMDSSLTLEVLSQQVLTRPYQRDLHRLRTLFTWIIQNITIGDQDKLGTGGEQCGDETATMTVTNTIQPSKVSLRQRLTRRRNTSIYDQEEELGMPVVDVMHGDGLLPEGGGNVDSFDDWLFSESAQQVLLHRTCSSSIGMANLFCEMATAVGCHSARVVYGYLREAPKDSINTASMNSNHDSNEEDMTNDNDNTILIQNHAWCCVKVEGEYRFVDCWLASPFQPQNKNKMESHWFLTKPTDLIYTHFPQASIDQCLEPVIQVTTFFALPYVWASFFTHHIKMIRYNPCAITLVDDQVCHLVFRVDPGVICFAFVETDVGGNSESTTIRCLSQTRMVPNEHDGSLERIYKVKAVLPPDHDKGWLKIYAGSQSPTLISDGFPSTRQDHGTNGSTTITATASPSSSSTLELPPLALCFRLTSHQHLGERLRPFEFVHLHPCRHEFYIREPQCYQLYPSQTYNFFVRGDHVHHKLAIKSPGGKLYKLMYYPQEHTYDGSVKIAEIGKWSLVSLLNHVGGWSIVATWECRD